MIEPRILLSQATITKAEENAVLRALRSGWVAPLGPDVDGFEQEIAERVGVNHALALSSGTAALHLALLRLGVSRGDYIPVPTMTFAATTNAIAYTGATPVFVDCLPDGNVNPELLLKTVDTLLAEGRSVPVALTVDLMGRCANYHELEAGLSERGVELLADAAESLGATLNGRAAGSFGRAAIFSFNGNKIMTTSGGGMLVSDDAELIEGARYLSTQARQSAPWYEHTEIGYNYRMSNILAALGRAQLGRLDELIERRAGIRHVYADVATELGFRLLGDVEGTGVHEENAWLSTVVLDEDNPATPADVIQALGARNIEARYIWKPMHLQPVYSGARGFYTGQSEALFARSVTLPSGAGMSDGDTERVLNALRSLLTSTSRPAAPVSGSR